MNLKGKIIQLVNYYGGDINDSFNEKVKKFVENVSKDSDETTKEYFEDVINKIVSDRLFSISKKLKELMKEYSSEISEFLNDENSIDLYHSNGMESPIDRLRSKINLDQLKAVLHHSTFRSYTSLSCELISDVYKEVCERFGLDYEYIMTGRESKKKQEVVSVAPVSENEKTEDLGNEELNPVVENLRYRMKSIRQSPTSLGEIFGRRDVFNKFFKGQEVSEYDVRFIERCISILDGSFRKPSKKTIFDQSSEFFKDFISTGNKLSDLPYKISDNEIRYLTDSYEYILIDGGNVSLRMDSIGSSLLEISFESDGFFLTINVMEFKKESEDDRFPKITYCKELLSVPLTFLFMPVNSKKKMIEKRIDLLTKEFQDKVISIDGIKKKVDEELRKAKENILSNLSKEEYDLLKSEGYQFQM